MKQPIIVLSVFILNFHLSDAQKNQTYYSTLSYAETLNGFRVQSVYLNDADKPMGARFIHTRTGFTLDLLEIESVPQAFIYVNSYPVSDKGEPHTQEHLLLTKGNKGHELNTQVGMSLASITALTAQLNTDYHFNTGAGPEVFFTIFHKCMDALLFPDYTDEEVKREVRNWGVAEGPGKTYHLEEKGSVYNEMSSTFNNDYALLYDTIGKILYGIHHPIGYNAGGLPKDIRILTETDISKFHAANYWLGNMGAIVSLSKSMALDSILYRMNGILDELNRHAVNSKHTQAKLPDPQYETPGKIRILDVPGENARQSGNMILFYPPDLNLNARENIELTNFLYVFASDATTNLYKIFVDGKLKQSGIDAQNVYAYLDDKQKNPVFIVLEGVPAENLTDAKARLVRQRVMDELKRVAGFPDHSPELLAFNKRYENSLISLVRYYAKFVNSPPKFGFRNTGDDWFIQLTLLNREKDFKKSVGFHPQIDEIRARLATGKNIWKEDIEQWKLLSVSPWVAVGKTNPDLNAIADVEKKKRVQAEVKKLESDYHLNSESEAILKYKSYYDSNTLVLEKMERAHIVPFIENPPLTLDNELVYKVETFHGSVPLVKSVFNNMTSATTGIALNLKSVPENQLVYLAMLPDLLTQTGILKNGKATSYEDMIQQTQQQILNLSGDYTSYAQVGRVELVVKAAGNNESESRLAVSWINDVLKYPYWTMDNLPRIQDLVDQQLSSIRTTMKGSEETWVRDPGNAYAWQDQPLYLATSSFLTREHNIFRLKWMLKKATSPADSIAFSKFISALAEVSEKRSAYTYMLSALTKEEIPGPDSSVVFKKYFQSFRELPAGAKELVKEAVMDLAQITSQIPDTSMSNDWKYICLLIQNCFAQGPVLTLYELNALRISLLNEPNTRLFMIGSEQTEKDLQPELENLLSGFSFQAPDSQRYVSRRLIESRVRARLNSHDAITFAGLINPDSHTGVFINSVPLITYRDTAREALLKFLAAELYGGHGSQSVYAKSTGAGLSYSTGANASPGQGNFIYYAERTPELPQTLQFVINEVKKSPVDTTMLDYIVSLTIGFFRSADDYETRGQSMANDLSYGITPELVTQFRKAILHLRKEPGLMEEVYKRKDSVYGLILPGYNIPSKEVKNGIFFVIGPEKQMAAYESYLKSSVNGPDTKLYRLYPRDFWMVE
jgi:Zn-dependent M16 (insulinase) family peptidase